MSRSAHVLFLVPGRAILPKPGKFLFLWQPPPLQLGIGVNKMRSRLLLAVAFCQLVLLCSPAAVFAGDESTIRLIRAEAIQHSAHGRIEDALSSFDNAIRMAEQIYGKDSTYVADLCFDAGLAALRADQYKKAEQCLQRAVSVTPNCVEARLKLAELYKKRGMMNDAKQQVQRVLQRHPDNFEAREILALTYQQEGNFLAANKECFNLSQLALKREPVDSNVAFSPPPPAVAPPPVAPTTVATPAPAPVPIGGISLLRGAPKKPAAAVPAKKAPEPVKKASPPPPAAAKKGKKGTTAKQAPAVRQENGPESSWGLPARMRSEAVLLTPIGKNKNVKAASEATVVAKKSAAQLRAEALAAKKAEAIKKAEALAAKKESARKAAAEAAASKKAEAEKVAAAKKAEAAEKAAAAKKADAEKAAAAKPEPRKSKGPSIGGEEPAEAADNGGEEEGFGGSSVSSKSKAKPAPPAPKPKPVVVKIEAPKHIRGGLVPPPPPVVPTFGGMMVPPPPAAVAPPAPRPKPKPVEAKPAAESKPASHASEDDSDFLLEWGGGGKKKGK
jgi:colicin import membrane protein